MHLPAKYSWIKGTLKGVVAIYLAFLHFVSTSFGPWHLELFSPANVYIKGIWASLPCPIPLTASDSIINRLHPIHFLFFFFIHSHFPSLSLPLSLTSLDFFPFLLLQVSSAKRLTESDGDEQELVDKGDHKAKTSSYKRSTSGAAGGHSSTWKSSHSSDTSNTKWTLPLKFQLEPSHFRSGEIKLRCLANYYHIIREYNTSIDVRSYNYQAIEAQSTSAASSCKLRCLNCSSNSPAFILLIILVTQLPFIHLQITYCLSTFLTWTHSYFIQLHPLFHSPRAPKSSARATLRPPSPPPPAPSSRPSLPSSPFTSSSSNSSFTSSPSSSLPGHLLPLKALPPLVSPMSSIMSRVNSDFHFSPAVCTSKITTKR